jgi:predicted ATPase
MLQVRRLTVENYRSIRRLSVPLTRLNVFVGENGVGKTNLYRALALVQAAAIGTLARELAAEGGMESAFWAGPRSPTDKNVRLKLGCELGATTTYGYRVEVGLPAPMAAGFPLEGQVKAERLEQLGGRRPVTLLERKNVLVKARNRDDKLSTVTIDLLPSETALSAIRDPGGFPDLSFTRDHLMAWRFYHSFRTDADAPLRRPCLAVTTPTLAADGADLAAVFATLNMLRGDLFDLNEAVADAFDGARVALPMRESEQMAGFAMHYPEFPRRYFEAAELSDGTLRFLALAGALLGYRPANLIALNEPETSLHPSLLPALARLIARGAERSQIWVVTHSTVLADAIAEETGAVPRRLYKEGGETLVEGLRLDGTFDDE